MSRIDVAHGSDHDIRALEGVQQYVGMEGRGEKLAAKQVLDGPQLVDVVVEDLDGGAQGLGGACGDCPGVAGADNYHFGG